jgi:hypothetical protein
MRLLKTSSLGATITAAALCPVMDLLALATASHVFIYRNRTQACLVTLAMKATTILAWSPGARLLAVCSSVGEVAILHIETGDIVRTFRGGAPAGGAVKSAAAAAAGQGGAPPSPMTASGRFVGAVWMPLTLPGGALPSIATHVLAMASMPPPQPGTPPNPAAGPLVLVHHALHCWHQGQAALLAVADEVGNVSLLLDGLVEVWALRLRQAANRLVRLQVSNAADLILVLSQRDAVVSAAASTAQETPPAKNYQLAFVDLAAVAAHCTAPSQLKAILVAEYAAIASTLLTNADRGWAVAVRRGLEKAADGPGKLADYRAAILQFLFRPAVPADVLADMNTNPPVLTPRRSGSRHVDPSAASSATEAAPAASSTQTSNARHRSKSRDASDRTKFPRASSPGNRGAGRGPSDASFSLGGEGAPPGEAVALQEQLQAAFVDALTLAVDHGQRALAIAMQYAGDLIPAALLQSLLVADTNAKRSTAAAMDGTSRDPAPRQSLGAATRRSTSQTVPGLAADDGTLPTVLGHMDASFNRWLRAVTIDRGAANAFFAWISSGGDPSTIAVLAPHHFASVFRLITSVLPNSDDEMSILAEVFGDDDIPGAVGQPVVTDSTRLVELGVARCRELLAESAAVLRATLPVFDTHGDNITVHGGLTLAETAEGAGVEVSSIAYPRLCWNLQPAPPAAMDLSTAGTVVLSLVAASTASYSTIVLAASTQYECLHPRPQVTFDPSNDDVAAALVDRAAGLMPLGCFTLNEGGALLVTTPSPKGPTGAAAVEADGSVTLWRLGLPPAADDDAETMPTSSLRVVVKNLLTGAASAEPIKFDVVEQRGFAIIVSGPRFALIDLVDDEDDSVEDDHGESTE